MVRPTARVVVDQVAIPMSDGVPLAADVIRPDDGAPHPVLLSRTPYGRAALRQTMDVAAFARDGWAVVAQDTRGRGESDGSGTPFIYEQADGADTVAWCAAQPWCDGRVSLTGASYIGYAAWAAAVGSATGGASPVRALNTIIAADGMLDGFIYEGGALCLSIAGTWYAIQCAGDNSVSADVKRQIRELADGTGRLLGSPHEHHKIRPLYEPYEQALAAPEGQFWSSVAIGSAYRTLDVPVHHVAGWYDIFAESGIRSWQSMRETARSQYARESQRLVIGPWPHTSVFANFTAEMNFGHGANGIIDGTIPAMWEWLRDATDGKPVQGGARVFVMGRNDWVELDDWPPPVIETPVYPTSTRSARSARGDGRLCLAPGQAGADRFLHDPYDPVPTRGGRLLGGILPTAGPIDQRPVQERSDVLVYTTSELSEDVTIMGPVRAHVLFETTGLGADVMVKLVDLYPDGRAMLVIDSVRRASFSPGAAQEVTVEVGSVAQTFRRGHRIRVEIASSNFPRFDANPSTGQPLAEIDRYETAQQTVHHGGRTGTRIVLPVVGGALPGE